MAAESIPGYWNDTCHPIVLKKLKASDYFKRPRMRAPSQAV
ncbi:hypothetical protein GJA_2151 [Janthinobacterium agaricidamnosum NBRC 102515 = DSM 9628]|uniref:Uncharacterized protein n=1 Tax=Janthinobacterium agaricidamnosum NBRC 102515 = DSM 9628 TaxID=1349767 RepID=W0V4H7_9BURK|nr:hypothetical protein GJA_2151 [Janthinobacterium agaricidamnosum NBRC 102515 = DSM 9628]